MPKTATARTARRHDLTNDLRQVLESAKGKASGWLEQRDLIAGELLTIRDTAQQLLTELSSTSGQKTKRTGRPGRRPGFKLSPSARRKIARAAKLRWAERKAQK